MNQHDHGEDNKVQTGKGFWKTFIVIRLHDLRHEATSRFFEKGLNVMEVMTITGHKTMEMLKRYTHLRAHDVAIKLG